MKILFDLLPLIAFFSAYYAPQDWGGGIFLATAAAVVTGVAQAAWLWFVRRRVDRLQLGSTALLVVLGGATLLLHDRDFIMWKPTAVYWLFAGAFLASEFIGEKSLIRRAMEAQIALPDAIWRRLNLAWVAFFALIGAANLVVAYTFDEATWVQFKVFGTTAAIILFVIAQALVLSRHARDPGSD